MKYTSVLFDLDGTIIDSSLGITKAVEYALDKHGVRHAGRESLKCFIGPPLREQFMSFCGVDEQKGSDFVNTYREYYAVKGIFECCLYEGVVEMLQRLKSNGVSLYIATSKPEKFAKKILEYFRIEDMFEYVGGANFDNTRTDKAQVIKYVLNEAGLTDKKSVVMIGDCTHDIIGAHKNGIDAIGVLYGFGEREDLEKLHTVYLCENTREISDFILN